MQNNHKLGHSQCVQAKINAVVMRTEIYNNKC